MGRFRLDPPQRTPTGGLETTEQLIRLGVVLHHRTDEAFHGHPWFTARVRALRDELEASGLSRGAARAVAHVGPELLLDGVLLADERAARSVDFTMAALDGQRRRLRPWSSPAAAWFDHLGLLARHGLPTDYADPEAVARRLFRILERRHRLGFDQGQVAVVAGHLARHQPSIEATGRAFLDEVVHAVTGAMDDAARATGGSLLS